MTYRLEMKTKDLSQEKVRLIGKFFPNWVTETKNGEKVVLSIDFDTLKQELSDTIIDTQQERYQFTWPEKSKHRRLANCPTTKTLRPCFEDSVDFENTKNIYIEGDNLEVLKILRETYLGKIKMIYIDPPYNTGNDFIYNDDYAMSPGEFLSISGNNDDDGNRLFLNTTSNGRFHTDWLNKIYPVIILSKQFLSDDGVIFISIDDGELPNIRKICDEVFGENNFVSNFIWQSRSSISNDYEVSLNHNHTLIYSKNRTKLIFGGDEIDHSEYINPDSDPRGPWKLVPLDANHVGGNTVYPIKNPKTGVDYYPPNGRIWCYNKEGMDKLLKDGRIKFGLNDDSAPKRKLYLNERIEKGDVKTPSSLLMDVGTTKTGTTELMELFDNQKVFDYPKPVGLIQRLIQYGAPNGGIIMDFFSGSGTTAHAVMNQNSDSKNNYQFILVQLPEDLDLKLLQSKESVKKIVENEIRFLDSIDKPHLLTEIGKERIRRAGTIISNHCSDVDVGFRVFKCDSSNMKNCFYSSDEITRNTLDDYSDIIKDDRRPEDLLVQVMLELGIELSSRIEQMNVHGHTFFSVDGGYLVACFDDLIEDSTVIELSKEMSGCMYAVFRSGLSMCDEMLANIEQIFKTYSPQTKIRIL